MKTSFQDGVDAIYNACVSAGSTPNDKTPDAIRSCIVNNLGGDTSFRISCTLYGIRWRDVNRDAYVVVTNLNTGAVVFNVSARYDNLSANDGGTWYSDSYSINLSRGARYKVDYGLTTFRSRNTDYVGSVSIISTTTIKFNGTSSNIVGNAWVGTQAPTSNRNYSDGGDVNSITGSYTFSI